MIQRMATTGILIFALAVPLENIVAKYPAVGSITRIIGIMVFILGIFAIIARRWVYATPRVILPVIAFVLWAGLTYLWSLNVQLTAIRFTTYVQLVTMLWLLWQFVDDRDLLERILQFYIFGAYVLCAITLINYSTHQSVYEDRYSAIGYDPNYFGVSLALGMPLAWFLFIRSKNIFSSLFAGMYIPVALLTVVLTGSRGAFLSTATASVFILASIPKMNWARRFFTLSISSVAVLGIIYYLPPEQLERFSGVFNEIFHGDASGRKQVWEAGLRVFVAHPWIGVGDASFPDSIQTMIRGYKVAHQTFLSILVETGAIGFTLFISFSGGCLWKLRSIGKGTDKTVCISILVTWIVSACSLNLLMNKFTWLMFAIVLIIERFAEAEMKESLNDTCDEGSKTELPRLMSGPLNPVYEPQRVYILRKVLGRD